jgi:DNA-binding NarL/FixJ family response regulator
VARGWSNERIAREMHLSMRSVSEVLTNIYQRLDMPASPAARLALVAWCNEHGY